MSRMSDMAQTIEELRSAAAAISDAADWLTKVFSSEPQAEDAPASPPEPELTLEQVNQPNRSSNHQKDIFPLPARNVILPNIKLINRARCSYSRRKEELEPRRYRQYTE